MSDPRGSGFLAMKFDDNFNLVEKYEIMKNQKSFYCSCPRGHLGCRHIQIFDILTKENTLKSPLFYDFDKKEYSTAVGWDSEFE